MIWNDDLPRGDVSMDISFQLETRSLKNWGGNLKLWEWNENGGVNKNWVGKMQGLHPGKLRC